MSWKASYSGQHRSKIGTSRLKEARTQEPMQVKHLANTKTMGARQSFLLWCRLLEELELGPSDDLTATEKEAIEIEIKYAGFVRRQESELAHMEAAHARKLDPDLDYSSITTLSMEAREKLAKVRTRAIKPKPVYCQPASPCLT